jgi:hypothetical protein
MVNRMMVPRQLYHLPFLNITGGYLAEVKATIMPIKSPAPLQGDNLRWWARELIGYSAFVRSKARSMD